MDFVCRIYFVDGGGVVVVRQMFLHHFDGTVKQNTKNRAMRVSQIFYCYSHFIFASYIPTYKWIIYLRITYLCVHVFTHKKKRIFCCCWFLHIHCTEKKSVTYAYTMDMACISGFIHRFASSREWAFSAQILDGTRYTRYKIIKFHANTRVSYRQIKGCHSCSYSVFIFLRDLLVSFELNSKPLEQGDRFPYILNICTHMAASWNIRTMKPTELIRIDGVNPHSFNSWPFNHEKQEENEKSF